MSGLIGDICNVVGILEFTLRQCIANSITWVDMKSYYHCDSLCNLRRAIMHPNHKGIERDLVVLQRTILGHITFVLIENNNVSKAIWRACNTEVMYFERSRSELSTLRILKHDRIGCVMTDLQFRPKLQYFSVNESFEEINLETNLKGFGGYPVIETLLSIFVFNQFPMYKNIKSISEILSDATFLATCSCHFVIGNELEHCQYIYGDVNNVGYWLIFHTEKNLWYIIGYEVENVIFYSSLHRPIAKLLNWTSDCIVSVQLIYDSFMTDMDGKYTNKKTFGIKTDETAVVIDRKFGTIEYVGVVHIDFLQKHLEGRYISSELKLNIEHFYDMRINKMSLNNIVYPMRQGSKYIVFDPEIHNTVSYQDYYEIFHDWRTIYANEKLGYIPNAANIYNSTDIIDPFDVELKDQVSFDTRWSPSFYSTVESPVNIDIVTEQNKVYMIALRDIEFRENLVSIPRDPIFIEPNDFLGKMNRFRSDVSPYLQSLKSDTNIGLFANCTLLQGYKYAQLHYCGKRLNEEEIEYSNSAYIWQCHDKTGIDGNECSNCYAKCINSADYISEGMYIQNDRRNVEMFLDIMSYIPTTNIIKGQEIITVYGQNYWTSID
jgi:hypothetical protein